MAQATFAAGCFWCVETIFSSLKGVSKALPGYAGGSTRNPTYKEVCSGTTGHAEVVQVDFDPAIISYETLLDVFFHVHDPTTLNRQGNDVGTQYRSAVFVHDEDQRNAVKKKLVQLKEEGLFDDPIVTTIEEFETFFPAEAEHLDYYRLNPEQAYCSVVIKPKVQKFSKQFAALLN